ncbi:hypothetical protein Hanom_Chr01g00080061 [Helianthus anomalus]
MTFSGFNHSVHMISIDRRSNGLSFVLGRTISTRWEFYNGSKFPTLILDRSKKFSKI